MEFLGIVLLPNNILMTANQSNIGKLLITSFKQKTTIYIFLYTSLYEKVGRPKVVWKELYWESNRKSYQIYENTLNYKSSKLE